MWAINPSAWGTDANLIGPTIFQPLLFVGQYQDAETAAFENDGATPHRSGLAVNGFRSYDPFSGSYLQVDRLVDSTWSSYVYVKSNPVGKNDPYGLATRLASEMGCEENCATAGDFGGCMSLCMGLEDLDPGASGGLDWSGVGGGDGDDGGDSQGDTGTGPEGPDLSLCRDHVGDGYLPSDKYGSVDGEGLSECDPFWSNLFAKHAVATIKGVLGGTLGFRPPKDPCATYQKLVDELCWIKGEYVENLRDESIPDVKVGGAGQRKGCHLAEAHLQHCRDVSENP